MDNMKFTEFCGWLLFGCASVLGGVAGLLVAIAACILINLERN